MHVGFPPAHGPQLLGKNFLFHLKRLRQHLPAQGMLAKWVKRL